ncbi:MAG: hypothetical protein ACLFRU_11900, partial [Paracoccaceae bacterium]
RLAAPSDAGNPLRSWVVFGDFPEGELSPQLVNAGIAAPGTVLRASNGAVAVAAQTQMIDGAVALVARPPRDVALEEVRVARPDRALQVFGQSRPSAAATGNQTGGMFEDTTFELSASARLRPPGLDTFVAVAQGITQPDGAQVSERRGDLDQVAVIRTVAQPDGRRLPSLVGRIPVGHLDADGVPVAGRPSVEPGQMTMSSGNDRLYVGLRGAAGVAVVDALLYRQVDVRPEDRTATNFIGLSRADGTGEAGPRVGDLVLDRANRVLFAADETAGRIFLSGTDPGDRSRYHTHYDTVRLDSPWAVTGLTMTPDFSQLVVTQSDGSDERGLVSIYDIGGDRGDELSHAASFGDGATGGADLFRNPSGVQSRIATEDGLVKIVALDAKRLATSPSYPGKIVVLSRSAAGEWSIQRQMPFSFPFEEDPDRFDDPFGVADPVDIAFSPDGGMAFVLGQRRFNIEDISRNPNLAESQSSFRFRNNPAGTNIAILENLFATGETEPRIVAATRGVPESWGTDIGISATGEHVVMSGGRLGNVLVYDIAAIEKRLLEEPDRAYYDYAINEFATSGSALVPGAIQNALRINDDAEIGVRAAYGRYFSADGVYVGPNLGSYRDNAPILTGGRVGGIVEARSAVNLDPEVPGAKPLKVTRGTGALALPAYRPDNGQPQPTFYFKVENTRDITEVRFTLAVAGEGDGLYPGDSDGDQRAALKRLGYRDVDAPTAAERRALLVEGNRNRIHTAVFTRDEVRERIEKHHGMFEVTLPADTVLTAGQQYFWGVESVLQADTDDPRAVFDTASLVVERARPPADAPYAGVTVLTHGLSVPFLGPEVTETPIFALGQAIARASGAAILLHDPATRGSDPHRYGNWVNMTRDIDPRTANAIVLVPDWIDAVSINDSGFAEGAADAFFADILALDGRL